MPFGTDCVLVRLTLHCIVDLIDYQIQCTMIYSTLIATGAACELIAFC